jgi:hypothetical protein
MIANKEPAMTVSSTEPVSLRIETGARALFRELAEHHGVTESVLLEHLTIEEAARLKLIGDKDPRIAFKRLLEEITEHLKGLGSKIDEDITLHVFNWIKETPRLLKMHEDALKPTGRAMTPEQRRQFVHQRIGRFIKEFLGRESGDEVILPRGTEALIRSYTKLIKT